MPLPQLYDYQKTEVDKIETHLLRSDTAVMSVCPSGGKTFMALHIAQPYLDRGETVVILTHATTILLDQWKSEIKKHHMEGPNLLVFIPQQIREVRKLLAGEKVALLIVDEAHEWYLAKTIRNGVECPGMVEQIIRLAAPNKQLLLTGTPSRFVSENSKGGPEREIFVVSGMEVFNSPSSPIQDTCFGLVRSAYSLHDSDRNETNDVKDTYRFTQNDTRVSLKRLVDKMLERLVPIVFKTKPNLTAALRLTGLSRVAMAFGTLEKTMLAAHDIQQALDIKALLTEAGVNCVVSVSRSEKAIQDECDVDEDCENIKRFMEDSIITVLIVVRRGILGFNMPELCNVVDFTCSRNIDRIYQLYARVLRKHPEGKDKFFFRLCSSNERVLDSFYLQAALCLNSRPFVEKYNGKNLMRMSIPVPTRIRGPRESSGKERGVKSTRPIDPKVDMLMWDEVLSLKLLNELTINSKSEVWDEIGWVQFSEVVQKLTGKTFHNVDENIEKIKAWILAHPVEEVV